MNITEYLSENAGALARAAALEAPPLHDPAVDPVDPRIAGLARQPIKSRTNAQAHAITASIKLLEHQNGMFFVGNCGTGKTFGTVATVHIHAAGPYRACCMVPGHITAKWKREILKVIPHAKVTILRNWKDAIALAGSAEPTGPEWFIIGRDRAKLGARWKPALWTRKYLPAVCPTCGQQPVDTHGNILAVEDLAKAKRRCHCGAPLWTVTDEVNRVAPAEIISKQLPKGFFTYFIGDEAHECAQSDSLQAEAFGALASSAPYKLALTGTLSNGKAESLRTLLFHICPREMVRRGFRWDRPGKFDEAYSRVQTITTETTTLAGVTRKRTTKKPAAGIMPSLFGDLLAGSTVFLTLDQVADALPALTTELVPVEMDADMRQDYRRIDGELRAAVGDMLRRGDRSLLGTMVSTLLAWPDYPFGWDQIGTDGAEIALPEYDPLRLLAKERALAKIVRAERDAGRKVWIYVEYTDRHDVAGRLETVLGMFGLQGRVLRADSATPEKREAWVAKHAPPLDFMISHKSLVQTGVDLFDNDPRTFNFPTLVFYEFGYKTTDLRQAASRHLRIGQDQHCRTIFLYHAGSMADQGLALMGHKVRTAETLEGRFDFDGLATLGADDSIEQALLKSIAENLEVESAQQSWEEEELPPIDWAKLEEMLAEFQAA